MRNEISQLKIKSKYFDPEVELKLFGEPNNLGKLKQISLVYGQNGSGKTTISKAISNIKSNEFSDIEQKILDHIGSEIILSEEEKKEIFVFNDDFMENKIRFRYEDKMGVIVMLGEQVDLDNEILTKKDDIKIIQIELGKLQIDQYDNEKSIKSPKYHANKAKESLSNTWGEREKNILGNSRRSPVSDLFLQEVLKSKILDLNTEKILFLELDIQYRKVKNITDEYISIDFSHIKSYVKISESIQVVFKKVIQKPIESELSRKIKYTLEKYNVDRLKEIENFFTNKDESFCPFCFRDYSIIEADKIISDIAMMINHEYNELIAEIDSLILEPVQATSLSNLSLIESDLLNDFHNSLNQCNIEIENINTLLEKKKNNPYDSIKYPQIFEQSIKQLINIIVSIEIEVNKINEAVKIKKNLLLNLQNQNKKYAIAECQPHITNYNNAVKELTKANESYRKFTQEIAQLNNDISVLESKKQNTELAVEKINKWLSLIFLDKNRIKLVFDNGKYAIKCRGKDIKLRNLSNGEKNAVGLSYFFASINENKSGNSYSDTPKLIVLDDPLSSFDFENKLGIFSFLKSLALSLVNNNDTKIIILTHQLDTMFSMDQMLNDDEVLCKSFLQHLLSDKTLKKFKGNSNVYHKLLVEVGEFLLPNFVGDISSIPNKVRRVLESFSTFNYGCGMSQLSTKESITQNIDNVIIREHLRDSMYRIILNTGSHLENQSKGIEEGMLIYFEDIPSLTITTKDVLLLINELNSSHFHEIYKDRPAIVKIIDDYRKFLLG